MGPDWNTRPVVLVRDISRAREFYLSKLGFDQDWTYEEEGELHIVQVSHNGCQLILSGQWPEDAGNGLMFVSINEDYFIPAMKALVDRGVELKRGVWGYDLVVVEDLDGNRLWFPFPDGVHWKDLLETGPPDVLYWGRAPIAED